MPDEPQPDLIHVEETAREELQADRADLFVTIHGSSFVAGTAALTKAREVSELVADLRYVSIADSDIHVQNVEAEVTSGVLGRTSSATYHLRIECKSLERIADVLGAITSQKNTKLERLHWLYPNDDNTRNRLLQRGIERVNEKARLIAAGLGVQLVGVSRFSYQYMDPEEAPMLTQAAPFARAKARAMTTEDLDMNVSHTKELAVTVTVAYRISELQAPTS